MLIRIISLMLLLFPASALALVPVVGTTSSNTSETGDTARVAKPSGLGDGDLVLILLTGDASNPGTVGEWTTPPGFTKIMERSSNQADVDVVMYYMVAGASEPDSYFVENSGGTARWTITAVEVTGQHGTPLEIAALGTIATGAKTDTTITTTNDSCLAFFYNGFDGADGFPVTLTATGWSKSDSLVVGSGGNGICDIWGTKGMPSNGATGNVLLIWNIADGSAGGQFAIRGISSGAAGGFATQAQNVIIID